MLDKIENRGGSLIAREVRGIERRRKIEQMILKGIGSIDQISVALGITWITANNDVKIILTNWADKHRGSDFEEKLAKRLEQAEMSINAAWVSYQRSRKDEEEISTVYTPIQCPACKGTGFKPETEDWCGGCDGKGEITKEVVTRRIKGKAGDANWMRVYQHGVELAGKLEGLFIERKKEPEKPVGPTININMPDGRIDFSTVPAELVLEAKELLERVRKIGPKQIEGPKGIIEQGGK